MSQFRQQMRAATMNSAYTMNTGVHTILRDGQWRGRRCFIIGGGESIKGVDLSPLSHELTIGINKSFLHISTDILYMMDTPLYTSIVSRELDRRQREPVYDRYREFPGVKVMLCPMNPYAIGEGTYVIRRSLLSGLQRSIQTGISGGTNSGFGAVMLAMALGANPIYLLGYDFVGGHWHSGYPGQDLVVFQNKLAMYRQEFERCAPGISELGFRVVNLNPVSELRCFEFQTVEEVLGGHYRHRQTHPNGDHEE